jgi:hypothetical protein
MSKRHQASRRRTFSRRQHEVYERPDRYIGPLGWVEVDPSRMGPRSGVDRFERDEPGEVLVSVSI